MAGDWLKIEAATPEKPEVFMIAERLKIDPITAFGRLFLVWRWFDQQTRDGNALSVTDSYIDHVAGVTGMAQAMRDVGWMTRADNDLVGVKLPNFERHNGKTAKTRALTARRVLTHKQRKGNDAVTRSALPREEKRRVLKPLGDSSPERQNLGRFWELDGQELCNAAHSIGVNTLGQSRQSIIAAIRAKLDAKPAKAA